MMPLRASIETVKAVPNVAVFSEACGGSCSSSTLSGVRARQIRPRACVAMKLITCGVTFSAAMTRSPSFSRSSSSTKMMHFPFLMSRIAFSMVSKGVAMSKSYRSRYDNLPLNIEDLATRRVTHNPVSVPTVNRKKGPRLTESRQRPSHRPQMSRNMPSEMRPHSIYRIRE